MARIFRPIDAENVGRDYALRLRAHGFCRAFGRLITMEKGHDEASKEHDLSLVRWRRRGRGAILRQDLSRFIRWRGARRTGRLSFREERGCVDGRVYGDGNSLPRAQWRTRVQAQRSVLVS